jgi:hypothetical protein
VKQAEFETSSRQQLLTRARALFPRGEALPEEVWRKRHLGIVVLLFIHSVGLIILGLVRGFPAWHALLEGSVPAFIGVLAMTPNTPRRLRSAMGALGLITCSAMLVHFSGGVIEMHFHFFVALGVLTLYQDWFTFLLALGYVVVHHGVFGYLAPHSVFNHPAAWRHPILWALIHGAFVLAMCGVLLVTWRLNENERARSDDFLHQLDMAKLKRVPALEINDNIVQGLTVAQLALSVGRTDDSAAAIDATLECAREIISDLLGEIQVDAPFKPGDLVRAKATTLRKVSDAS